MQSISSKTQHLLQEELRPSEHIVWSSSPKPSRMMKKTIPIVLFGIPWTAFSLFWIAGASGFEAPNFNHGFGLFPLFGLPFVLIGFGMLSSPYWAARKAAASAYAITNERAILIESNLFGGVTVRSFLPHQLFDVRRVQFSDGSGDLILDRKITTDNDGSRSTTAIGFFGIQDVKQVESLILALAKLS